jgi:hypothetical protein
MGENPTIKPSAAPSLDDIPEDSPFASPRKDDMASPAGDERHAKFAHSADPPPKKTSTIMSAQLWDVVAPPPTNSRKGHLLPKGLQKFHRHRRISIEVHRVINVLGGDVEAGAGRLPPGPPNPKLHP